jgi:predicted AlkP superfamily phosphohydrolase/phosphomutase
MKKVIAIGFDGLEPTITEAMLASGDLPNLKRLSSTGVYSRIQTTSPAQTPVAWSTFSTGVNPGGHGIFDFLGRDPKTYLPFLALTRYEQKNAFVPPRAVNNRSGTPIWQILANAGIPSTIIRMPCTFPPDDIPGRMLAGVGVPDLRGGLGTSTFYTTRDEVQPESSEKMVRITLNGDKVNTYLIGPYNAKGRGDLQVNIVIHIDRQAGSAFLQVEGESKTLELPLRGWSDWLKVRFKSGLLQAVQGMMRFNLRQIEPHFELYASPINFDPQNPMFPISTPAGYAAEIESRLGAFYTLGMAEEHDGLIYGRIDEAAFWDQCSLVVRERRKLMLAELNRFKEGFFFCLFDTPDRLQHMFWRFREPDHPAASIQANGDWRYAIEEHYRQLDVIVGEVLKSVDDQTLLMVLSDHGMNSFKRGLNLNTWLYENGFLALKIGYSPGEGTGDFFQNVDWDQTRAYALGLGGIFINERDRESNGIVLKSQTNQVKQELIKQITGLRDEEQGRIAVRNVKSREEIYSGPFIHQAPDLLVNFAPGYRVSWGTPLGGTPAGLFEDNQKRWGGDHVIDPNLVPGVFFANHPFKIDQLSLLDLAPTIIKALGLERPIIMEGQSIL